MKRLLLLLLTVASIGSSAVYAQDKSAAPPIRAILDNALTSVEKNLVSGAEAMPAAKFDFAPTQGEFKGVRTFAQQVKHVGDANYMMASGILGEKPPVDTRADLKSREEILKYLKDSFAYAHKAFASITEQNQFAGTAGPSGRKTTPVDTAILISGHCWDHYGQLVEYLRMNGIVPPASRPREGQ